jgi:uncharacterized protein YcnI
MKRFVISLITALVILATPTLVSAHVIVTPNQAGVGQELVFNESVPNEQQTAVTSVKLLIPTGVTDVIPTVKPGWYIQTTTDKATNPEITSITWTGNIPIGQRDDFTFSAQVPGSSTELDWKAYQTYADGTVVHWDQKPAGSDDSTGNAGPYSITKVVNDLTSAPPKTNSSTSTLALAISVAALVLSLGSLFMGKKK